ncbi:MAG: hypothetical protein J3K34DRAFT_462341, partial [Monoraphidium minutum]
MPAPPDYAHLSALAAAAAPLQRRGGPCGAPPPGGAGAAASDAAVLFPGAQQSSDSCSLGDIILGDGGGQGPPLYGLGAQDIKQGADQTRGGGGGCG